MSTFDSVLPNTYLVDESIQDGSVFDGSVLEESMLNKSTLDKSLLNSILIYHWQAWDGFLISHLVADNCQLEAKYNDDIANIEGYLTPNIRAVLFQVNLSNSTSFPEQRQQLIRTLQERNILVLNTEVEDISKRNLHDLLKQANLRSAKANKTGPADQLLFIKSNFNWGGELELRLPEELQQKLLPQYRPFIQGWDNYFTIERGNISEEIWKNESVVIETYIHNSEGSFYRVYGFGDSIVVVKAHSPALIKKLNDHPNDKNSMFIRQQILTQKTELTTDLQETIKGFITHYPLAYFCLDIVHDTNLHYIIDLNLTPYAGIKQQTSDAVEFLCQGGREYIERKLHMEMVKA